MTVSESNRKALKKVNLENLTLLECLAVTYTFGYFPLGIHSPKWFQACSPVYNYLGRWQLMNSFSPSCMCREQIFSTSDTLFGPLYEINSQGNWYFHKANDLKTVTFCFYIILMCNLFSIVTFYNVTYSCEIPLHLNVFYFLNVYWYIKGKV